MKRQTRREFLAATAAGAAAIAAPNILRAQQLVLRWADGQPATHPSPQSAVKAGAEIKEKTGGRVEIQSFPNGQLGSSRDMVESVASGALTMVTEGAAQLGQFVPQLSLVWPFIMVAIVIRTIDALKAFDTIFVITQGGPGTASETLNIFLYLQAFQFYKIGYASAVVVIFFVIIIMLSLLLLYARQKSKWNA